MLNEHGDRKNLQYENPPKKQSEFPVKGYSGMTVIEYSTGHKAYYIRIKYGGRRCRIKLGDESTSWAQIELAYHQTINDINNGLSPVRINLTVDEYFHRFYLPWAKTNKASHKDDLSRFNSFIKPYLGKRILNRITTLSIQEILNGITGYTPATKNRIISLLRAMFRQALIWQLVNSNPATYIKQLKENNMADYVLSTIEVKAIINAAENINIKLANLLKLQACLAARIGEIVNLKYADIDLTLRRVQFARTKNGTSRTVPLNNYAYSVVSAMIENATSGEIFLFPSNNTPCNPMSINYRLIKSIALKAEVPKFKPHDLRRWAASTAANDDVGLKVISSFLGHSSTRVTEQRYAFVNCKPMQKATDSINNQLNYEGIKYVQLN